MKNIIFFLGISYFFVSFTFVKAQISTTPSGDVGIGTSSPSEKLHVVGKLRVTNGASIQGWASSIRRALYIRADGGTGSTTSGLYLETHDHYRGTGVFTYSGPAVTGTKYFWFMGNPYTDFSNSFIIARVKKGTTDSRGHEVESARDAAKKEFAKFYLSGDGDVGIGTITPTQKLDVAGKIHAQEILVDIQVSVGPDYVFKKDYDLPSLSEVSAYVEKHKHLPEIPSAKEMAAEGLHMKEMTLKLLKKVEEMTLYLIEQDKQLIEQDKRLKKLEEENKKLRNK